MANEILRREIKRKGGVKVVADAIDVTPAAIYMWINEHREPSDTLLKYLGLERRVQLVKPKP